MKQGETGTVNWKVDVTQTGFTARNAIVSGTIDGAEPERRRRDRCHPSPTRFRATRPSTVTVVGAPYVSIDLTVPANGSLDLHVLGVRDSATGGTNAATATATLDGVDVSDSGAGGLHLR